MGDFNANLDRFYTSVSKHNKGSWQYTLLHYLQQHRFSDLQQIFSHDPDQPGHTFVSPQNGAVSRIDAIFTSPNFPFLPLYCHTRKSFLYLSDHIIVAAYFQPIESSKEKHEKRLRTRSKIYNVHKMEADDWQKFSEYSDKYYHDHNYQIYERLPANRPNLNLLWTKLKELLITTANKTVPCSYRSAEDRLLKPKVLITCYSALKKMNNILLKFRTKLISRALWPDDAEWSTLKNTIRLVIEEHQLDPLDLPVTITTDNVRPIKKLLLGTYKLIYHKARLERIRIEHSRIQSNIKLRCTNYDQDLTRMIDSILNRERRRIVLDRLLYKDPVQGHILITDTDTI